MLSRRPHIDPFSLNYAEVYMRQEKVKNFDLKFVESYQRVKDEIIAVQNSNQESNNNG